MPCAELIAELKGILPPKSVLSEPSELLIYESDAFTAAKARPLAVLFPTSTEQVVAVVKILARRDIQIVPRGAGTGLAGGCVAFENGVIISTTRMNRILKIDLENRCALVEAGVRNTQLSDAVALLPGGGAFHFAPDPSSQRTSSIGGNAATNAGGIHTLKDFASSNHILGIEMVLADGQVLEAGGKDGCCESAGLDLPGLICGSEGTLGIITKLWVRLAPKASAFRTILSTFSNTADACEAVGDVIAAGMLPAAMEMLDGRMVRTVEDAFHLGLPGEAQALVVTEIDGIDALLDEQMNEIAEISRRPNAISVEMSADPAVRATLWKARKSAFGAIGRVSHCYCTQDACVSRSMLAAVLRRIDGIGKSHGVDITTLVHAADGNIHPIFLYDDRDESRVQNTLAAVDEVLKYCVEISGTATGEHGIGLEKLHLMPFMFDRATLVQFHRVKESFDPQGRINAGKLIAADTIDVSVRKPGRHVPQ
jgi:glycolate oxidase